MSLGRYRLIAPLGRGCQGEVWRALQVEPIVEEVALKLLTPARADHPLWRSQFHREAVWGAGKGWAGLSDGTRPPARRTARRAIT